MYKVYVCLLGQWTELTKDYQIGYNNQFFSPYNWAKDGYIKNAHDFIENSFYDMPIVQIIHKDKKYFLSPVHIQIAIEEQFLQNFYNNLLFFSETHLL